MQKMPPMSTVLKDKINIELDMCLIYLLVSNFKMLVPKQK